jgi:hypothetical protein
VQNLILKYNKDPFMKKLFFNIIEPFEHPASKLAKSDNMTQTNFCLQKCNLVIKNAEFDS